MTREEAIEIFKNMLDAWDNYYTIAQSDKKREAIWLAISSLETDEAYQLEYERTTKNDLGVDCISREAVFEAIDDCNSDGLKGIFCSYDDGERFKEYIKNLPSVTPQDPILDKIRAEIKQYQSDYDVYGTEYDRTAWKAFNRCLQIIDKYKAEIEPQESEEI